MGKKFKLKACQYLFDEKKLTAIDMDELIDFIIKNDQFCVPEGFSITKKDVTNWLITLKDKNKRWEFEDKRLVFRSEVFQNSNFLFKGKPCNPILSVHAQLDADSAVEWIKMLINYDTEEERRQNYHVFYIYYQDGEFFKGYTTELSEYQRHIMSTTKYWGYLFYDK